MSELSDKDKKKLGKEMERVMQKMKEVREIEEYFPLYINRDSCTSKNIQIIKTSIGEVVCCRHHANLETKRRLESNIKFDELIKR